MPGSMAQPRRRRLWFGAAACLDVAGAVYLPGFSPTEYQESDLVAMKVNKLTSVKTQLPYGYYDLPYCRPPGGIVDSAENLGETLMGDLIENSPYEIKVKVSERCKHLCTVDLTEANKDKFRSMIEDEYLVNLILDSLPVATRYRQSTGDFTYMDGFLVGVLQTGQYFVHNHLTFTISYHANPDLYQGYRIVGFEVEPHSMRREANKVCEDSGKAANINSSDKLVFTYGVRWQYSDVRWASRWDQYLKMTGGQIHWFAILNSVLVLLVLSAVVAMIILRTLHRDIAAYNELTTADEAQEDTGWKLVHGDVFRRPRFSTLLAVSVGSGMQILGMSIVILGFALLGLLSPAHRGSLLQSVMLLFTLMGILAGYISSRFCKLFEGDEGRWKLTTLATAFLYPGLFFVIFFLLNLCIWGEKSSGAVPFSTLFAVLVLWFGVSVPLVFFGAYAGFRKPAIELPVKVSPIPRAIPETPWYSQPLFVSLVGGIFPFGAVFTEMFFIMSSIWLHQFYYLFGFLALSLVILLVTCAEISIALTYFQLSAENYSWWWTSFFSSGSSAVYVFLNSVMYFSSRLHIEKTVSTMLYFGYMGIISICFMLLTGAIGTISSFFFVRAIYGSVKVD